jgi:hypothetical protein
MNLFLSERDKFQETNNMNTLSKTSPNNNQPTTRIPHSHLQLCASPRAWLVVLFSHLIVSVKRNLDKVFGENYLDRIQSIVSCLSFAAYSTFVSVVGSGAASWHYSPVIAESRLFAVVSQLISFFRNDIGLLPKLSLLAEAYPLRNDFYYSC